jgi:DNA-binding MarR family transcriptional regulator
MPAWLKKVLHDVAVRVGAGVILGALVAIWLWGKSNFSVDPSVAWSAVRLSIRATWCWLWSPLGIPRVIVWLTVALIAIAALRAWWRRQRTPVQVPRAPPPNELTANDLNGDQRRLLSMLIRNYPRSSSLPAVSEVLQLQYPAAERLCESLERMGLVTITPGLYDAKSVFMTVRGRDFCYEQGLAVDR